MNPSLLLSTLLIVAGYLLNPLLHVNQQSNASGMKIALAAPVSRLPQPGQSGWDADNIETAFDPANRRGRNPIYEALGVSRYALEGDGGAGSGNFYFAVPILNLTGRGIDVTLALHYNSRLWHCVGQITGGNCSGKMVYNIDGDWPAPGWSLGFGKLIGTMLIDADGTRHDCKRREVAGRLECYTPDGFFIDLWQLHDTAEASYPDGTVVRFDVRGLWEEGLATLYPSRITDANGNYISIAYRNNLGPTIDTVTDTMGRVITFNYDQSERLVSITGPGFNGSTGTWIRLHYGVRDLKSGFAPSATAQDCETLPGGSSVCQNIYEGEISVIEAIHFPGSNAGYWFGDVDSYSSYGMLTKVSERRAMQLSSENDQITAGILTHERIYDYPLRPDFSLTNAPTYSALTEKWEGMDTAPAVTRYAVFQDATPSRVEVTYPDGTRSIQLSQNIQGQFDHDVFYYTAIVDAQDRTLQETILTWEIGDYDAPRIKRIEVTGELPGQKSITEYGYGPKHNQITEVRVYDYDGVTILRREQTEYVTDPGYKNRHIFNLPAVVQVFEGLSSTPLSRIEYQYDGEPLANTPGVVSHSIYFDPLRAPRQTRCIETGRECDPDRQPPCTEVCVKRETISLYRGTYRGNVTTITRYTDAANQIGAIAEERRYDITGNLRSIAGACCVATMITYDASTQYAYPTIAVRGDMDSASTTSVTTTTRYDFNTGVPLSATDENGQQTLYSYWSEPVRLRAIAGPAGGLATYYHDDSALSVTETVYNVFGQIEAQTIQHLNGLGLARRVESWAGGDNWNVTETQFDAMGRVWKQSLPFRQANNPQDEQKYWSELTYDSLGRVTAALSPDGSVTRRYYNETNRPDAASAAIGQTVRAVDPWGRERWMRSDVLGQLVEIVMPDPDGTGSIFEPGGTATYYQYNALGLLTQVLQGPRPQRRRFQYDSLGRLTHQYLPEKLHTLNHAGQYRGAGGQWSDIFTYDERGNLAAHTDARGVKTVFGYDNDPLNRLQSITYDVSGVGDTSSPILPANAVRYEYVATDDVTRLWRRISDGLSTEEFVYDNFGRLWSKTLILANQPGKPITVGYTHDSLNRLAEVILPAQYGVVGSPRKVVRHDYQEGGSVNMVTVDGKQYAEIAYNPAGQMVEAVIGSAVREVYLYHPASQLLERQQVVRAGNVLFDLSYEYLLPGASTIVTEYPTEGRTGQVTRITDNLNPAGGRTYVYDAWGRLRQAASGSSNRFRPYDWLQEYSYDAYGNRTNVMAYGPPEPFVCPDPLDCTPPPLPELPTDWRDGLGALSYDAQTNRITTSGFAYDAAGNQIRSLRSDGHVQQYQYDAAGRLVKVLDEDGRLMETYSYYDASNLRLSTQSGNVTTHPRYYIWHGMAVLAEYAEYEDVLRGAPVAVEGEGEILLDPAFDGPELSELLLQKSDLRWDRSYIFVGDRLLATIEPDANGAAGVVQYHHPDRLSTRLITDPANNNVSRQETFPFGVEVPGGSGVGGGRKFTSYDRSNATKLDYAVNRFYDAQQGRFMQVDPLRMGAVELGSPLSLNMYNYVRSNPVNAIDSAGLIWMNAPGCGMLPGDTWVLGGCISVLDYFGIPDNSPSGTGWGDPRLRKYNFGSKEEAVRRALCHANPRSISENIEYAGLIYETATGTYDYTDPARGSEEGSNPFSTLPAVPIGGKVIGDYHTHADYSVKDPVTGKAIRTGDPLRDNFNSDDFSGAVGGIDGDRPGITAAGVVYGPGYRGYLGTPSRVFKVFDPATGNTIPLGKVDCEQIYPSTW